MKKLKRNIFVILGVQVPIVILLFAVIILCKLLNINQPPSLIIYGLIGVDIVDSILLCMIIKYNGYDDSLL